MNFSFKIEFPVKISTCIENMSECEKETILPILIQHRDIINVVEDMLSKEVDDSTFIGIYSLPSTRISEEEIIFLSGAFDILFLKWKEFEKYGLSNLLKKSEAKKWRKKSRRSNSIIVGISHAHLDNSCPDELQQSLDKKSSAK